MNENKHESMLDIDFLKGDQSFEFLKFEVFSQLNDDVDNHESTHIDRSTF